MSESRFGLAVGRFLLVSRGTCGSIPLRLSVLFKSCGLRTLSIDFVPHHEWNIAKALVAAHLDAEIILVVTVRR